MLEYPSFRPGPGSAKGPLTGEIEGSIMAEQIPDQAGPETEPSKPRTGTSSLHLASGDDAIEEADRDDRLDAILTRGDIRDQAAERRDRRADRRPGVSRDGQARVDRDWAGRDRDAAAIDRAELVGMLEKREAEPVPPVTPESD